MEFKISQCKYKYIAVILSYLELFAFHCQSMPIELVTTTPKVYKDQFPVNRMSLPVNTNSSYSDWGQSGLLAVPEYNKVDFPNSKSLGTVKAVNLAEKTMRESHQNGDDEDDDDGGESMGLGRSCGNSEKKPKESVPLVIVHEMDMLAMQLPMRNNEKNDKNKEQKQNQCSNANSNMGMESYKTRLIPKAVHKDCKTEQKINQDHKTNGENSLGNRHRDRFDDDMKYVGEHGMDGIVDKDDLSDGLLARRDVDYVLGDDRMHPFGNRQVPKESKYIL